MPFLKSSKEQLRKLVKDEESLEILLDSLQKSNIILTEEESTVLPTNYFLRRIKIAKEISSSFSDSVICVTGYSSDELEGMPGNIHSIIHEDDFEDVKNRFTDFVNEAHLSSIILTYRIRNKEGEIRWLRELCEAVKNSDGKITEVHSHVSDITELIAECDELKNMLHDSEEKNAAKDKFISIISHDLRSPFTSLLGFSEILLNDSDLSAEDTKEYLGYIYEASETELKYINNLLYWSRLQLGKIVVEPVRTNLKDLLSNSTSALIGNAIRKNVEIKTEVDPSIHINADEKLLGHALKDLVDNAIKYSKEDSVIRITAGRFKDGAVEVIIKDQGTGIPEAHREKLFKIDQKFSVPGTKGEKGSGMGLKLVNEIVSRHNGEVWFYSKEGEGSEFHFTIPEARQNILIIHNDSAIREKIRSAIESEIRGVNIYEAENGYKAMQAIFNGLPSCIIAAHVLPLMTGNQLVEAIRRKDVNLLVRIIILADEISEKQKEEYDNYSVDTILKQSNVCEMIIPYLNDNFV